MSIEASVAVAVFKALLKVAGQNNDLKVTVTETLKGTAITATATLVGGLALGPVGLAVGGAIGGAAAYATSKPYKPIYQVLNDMDERQRQELAQAAISEGKKLGIDLTAIAIEILDSVAARKILAEALKCCGYKVK